MPRPLTAAERDDLRRRAREAAANAYAPYSKFRVGAAVLGDSGCQTGVNVENASYGLSMCAERSALAAAVAHGDRSIRAIAVACIDAPAAEGLPCGACLQWLQELAPEAEILIAEDQTLGIHDLLPRPFTLKPS